MSSSRSSPEPATSEPAGISRRQAPKSKRGCKTCKRRKIKCGEERPSCRNCIRHDVECDFLSLIKKTPSQHFAVATSGPHDLNMLDLELLLNFTTSTYATLTPDRILQDLWRTTVPSMGLRCNYIMRSILAISALHLGFHRPEKREFYTSTALRYHQLASREAMGQLENVTEDSAENLFMFSVMTICVALGSPRKADGTILVGESSCPDWMTLLMGTKSILAVAGDRIKAGRLRAMMTHGGQRWETFYKAGSAEDVRVRDKREALDHLLSLVDNSVADEGERRTYANAIGLLRESAHILDTRMQAHMTDMFLWIWRVADDFLPLLQVPTQEAVVILVHFCVYLKLMEGQWWLTGWADHLISRAWEILDGEHRLWIQWPIEEAGWVAP